MFLGVPLTGRSFRCIFFGYTLACPLSCKVLETLQDCFLGPDISQKRMSLQ